MSNDLSPLNEALRQFEATEANLGKIERIWEEIESLIPEGVSFDTGANLNQYEDRCRAFREILKVLPAIDGQQIPDSIFGLNEIGQMRFDAWDVGEFSATVHVEELVSEQGRHIQNYRARLNSKRRELVRSAVTDLIAAIDADLQEMMREAEGGEETGVLDWEQLRSHIDQMGVLMGSSFPRPNRSADLQRHLHFAQLGDLHDIVRHDWPAVKASLTGCIYGEDDPLPVSVSDLGSLVSAHPSGPVAVRLKWETLSAEEFERLLFCLISGVDGYENPQWLTHTNAPDKGRDLSANRVLSDPLSGTLRHRVIMQCKHWLTKSVGVSDVAEAKEQMRLWEPPRVDVLVIAASGRFTTDAVELIEKHNRSDAALRIEMWPSTHLERLLSAKPALIATFRLR